MPTFAEQQLNPNKDPFFGHEDLHLGHKIPLVERDDIHDGAITSEKIADEAVTAEKLATGSVGHEQLAPEAVADLSRLEQELQGLIDDARIFMEMPYDDATDEEVAEWFNNNQE